MCEVQTVSADAKWTREMREAGVIRRTRYKLLGFRWDGHKHYGCWRVVDLQTGNSIGPQYPSTAELLADLDRVAEVYGY